MICTTRAEDPHVVDLNESKIIIMEHFSRDITLISIHKLTSMAHLIRERKKEVPVLECESKPMVPFQRKATN